MARPQKVSPAKKYRSAPATVNGFGTVKLDDVTCRLRQWFGSVCLGIAVGDNGGPGLKNLALQTQLQVLGSFRVQVIRFFQPQDSLGIAAAQDPQGFLVLAPGLGCREVVGKIRALDDEGFGGYKRSQGLGQGIPFRLLGPTS